MRYAILVIIALIASAQAIPSNPFKVRQGSICDSIGEPCDGDEKSTCCEKTGFAFCKKGKIKFKPCKDGCGSIAGTITCIDNPSNRIK